MLHIYYGNGKGKTSAAAGSILRANGAGMKTAFFQFLKNGSSSENIILQRLENNEVICCKECRNFTFKMNELEKALVKKAHDSMLRQAVKLAEEGVKLIVLDEFLDAYNKKMLDTALADSFIESFRASTEIIVTGREPSEKFLEAADYVTEMKAVKHPFNKGVSARKGIEY